MIQCQWRLPLKGHHRGGGLCINASPYNVQFRCCNVFIEHCCFYSAGSTVTAFQIVIKLCITTCKYHNKSHIGHSSAICHLKPRLSAFVSIHPPPPPIDATYISTSGHIHMIYHQAFCFIPRSLLLITTCTNVLSMFPLHVATLNCNLIERCKTPVFRSWTTAHEFGHFLLQCFFHQRHLKDHIAMRDSAIQAKLAFKGRVEKLSSYIWSRAVTTPQTL